MNDVLDRLIRGVDLAETEAADLLTALTDATQAPAVVGAVLAAFRAKGETAAEVRGFATAMRRLATHPPIDQGLAAIDIVGTGGDRSGSLNLSTGTALLVAACGVPVVKHGNRSISSQSGSADVLEHLGYTLPPNGPAAAASLDALGFTFLFAPHFHPAMKMVAPVRRALGVRTIFNILGPLTNPAAPPFYLLGAFDPDVAALMADALSGLPIRRAFVVHGAAGWDEPTPIGPFELFDVHPGRVDHTQRDPADVGLPRCTAADLAGGDVATNAAALGDTLRGTGGAHLDALVLGAGLALEVTGHATDWSVGIATARTAITDGRAGTLLDRLASG